MENLMKEIEVSVKPFWNENEEFLAYRDQFIVRYRLKRENNVLNFWKDIITYEFWGYSILKKRKMTFRQYDEAVEYAKKIKENPEIVFSHIAKEKERIAKNEKELKECNDRKNRKFRI